jgi:phenylalanyl-tRNA synthetase beta chain
MCKIAILSATEILLQEFSREKTFIASSLHDSFPAPYEEKLIKLNYEKTRKHLGVNLSDKEITTILSSLGFAVRNNEKDIYEVKIPSWRNTKDVNIVADLEEEIIRLYGFDKVPDNLPALDLRSPLPYSQRNWEHKIRQSLATQGWTEVMNYSLVPASEQEFCGKDQFVAIQNPLSSECSFMRQGMVFGMLKNLETILRTHHNCNFFEIGRTYHFDKKKMKAEEVDKLILFSASLATKENDLFIQLQNKIIEMFGGFNFSLEFLPISEQDLTPYEHPNKTAEIFLNGKKVGVLSSLHPQKNDIKKSKIVFAVFKIAEIDKLLTKIDYKQITNYPAVHRDLSIVIPSRTLVGKIIQNIKETSALISQVEIFDDFNDEEKLGKDKRNIAFHLQFKSTEKTLNDEIINAEFLKIVQSLSEDFGAKLRLDYDQELLAK